MSKMHVPKFNEILYKSMELYKANFRRLFLIGVLAAVFGELLQTVSNNAGLQRIMLLIEKNGVNALQGQVSGKTLGIILFLGCLGGLIWLIAHALCVVILNESWQGRYMPINLALKNVWPCLMVLIATTIIAKMLIGFGLILYVIPGVIISAFFFVYVPVILFENLTIISALKRSSALAKVYFWPTLWMSFFAFFFMVFPDLIGALVKGQGAVSNLGFGLDRMIIVFLSALFLPFVAALILTQYHVLKAVSHNQEKGLEEA